MLHVGRRFMQDRQNTGPPPDEGGPVKAVPHFAQNAVLALHDSQSV